MSKTIIVRLKKAGNRTSTFSITDSLGNILSSSVTKAQLIKGVTYIIEDNVYYLTLSSNSNIACCSKSIRIPLTTITNQEIADLSFIPSNSSTLWKHLTNTILYNSYYGCTFPYIIEYPFSYQYQDEILQNVQDYTKAYTYLPSLNGVFNDNRKIQTDDEYFNKAVLYNDQQSTGILELVPKPVNNLKSYLQYPKYNSNSKTILYTKSDNFYQYNTFWSLVKDKTVPLFIQSCESLSIDKEVNQDNMDYSSRTFNKAPLRAKDLKIRHILDDSSSTHLVSQFIISPSQLSYK